MIEADWPLFILASLILVATPGQDMVLVMSRSVTQGTAAGVATAGGVSVGLIGHTLLATVGLGAILRASEWLFFAFKLVGAIYLIYLGLEMLRAKTTQLDLESSSHRSLGRLFLDGAFSNLSNPKIAVFYFAFLPQFVAPSASQPALSVFALGLMFALLTFFVKGPIGIFAARFSSLVRSRPSALRWFYRLCGAILVGLGLRLGIEPGA